MCIYLQLELACANYKHEKTLKVLFLEGSVMERDTQSREGSFMNDIQ